MVNMVVVPTSKPKHDVDPRENLLSAIGDLSKVDVFNSQVLVALYIRPPKTAGGIILTDKTVDEDIFQSKIGLVVKKGTKAFVDDKGEWFVNEKLDVGDWVISRPSDGWSVTINGVPCRIIADVNIKGRTDHPDRVW